MKKRELDDNIAIVKGHDAKRNNVEFDLSLREIKHIRRCALLYLKIHPELNDDELEKNLSYIIHKKFRMFGSEKRRINNKKKMEGVPYVCSHKNCKVNKNLEIDHIIPLSAEGGNLKENLRYLCKNHHRIKEIKYILKRKELEVKKLKNEWRELGDGKETNCKIREREVY